MIDSRWPHHHQSPWGIVEPISPFMVRLAKGEGHWTFESVPMPHQQGPMQWFFKAHWNNLLTYSSKHHWFGANALMDHVELLKHDIDLGFEPYALQRSWVIQTLLRKHLYKAGLEGTYLCVLENNKIWVDPLGSLCKLIQMSHLDGYQHQGCFLRKSNDRYIAEDKSGFYLDLTTSRHEKLEHIAQSQNLYLRNFPVKKGSSRPQT